MATSLKDPVVAEIVQILTKARPGYREALLDVLTQVSPLIQSRRIRPDHLEQFDALVQNSPLRICLGTFTHLEATP